jgi:hypothetical protein
MNAPRKCSFSFGHHFFLGMGAFIIYSSSLYLPPLPGGLGKVIGDDLRPRRAGGAPEGGEHLA